MEKHKVQHFKEECIGCGACAAVSPDFWEMDDEGMANLKGSKNKGDHWEIVIESEVDKATNEEAADVCPVSIIKLKEEE
jgi:ferredoxin